MVIYYSERQKKNDNKEGVTTRSKTRAFIITMFPTF